MLDAYKVAAQTGNYSGIPTYTEAQTLMKGFLKTSGLQIHHTIPQWLQTQLMAITGKTWDENAVPAIVWPQPTHTGAGALSFHNVLDLSLQEGKQYNEEQILSGLQKAYSAFGEPDVWTVANAWLTDVMH